MQKLKNNYYSQMPKLCSYKKVERCSTLGFLKEKRSRQLPLGSKGAEEGTLPAFTLWDLLHY